MKCRVLPFLLISFAPVLRAEVLPVLNAPMANLTEPASRGPRTIALNNVFGTELIDKQVVRFTSKWPLGGNPLNIDFAMFSNRTPVTRTNFLSYVTSGAYANTFFHRSVSGFVVQGGGFRLGGGGLEFVPQNSPIINEFGVSNTLGTVSMAKLGNDPNSATNQFFVSTGENSDNLDFQNGGFTVFARVTKSTMENVLFFNNLNEFRVWNGSSIHPAFSQLPLQSAFNNSAGQLVIDYLSNFPSVTLEPLPAEQAGTSTALTYSIHQNTNPSLVTAAIVSGGQLQLNYIPAKSGNASITVRATDSVGNTVDDTFTIEVEPYDYGVWKNANFSGVDLSNPAVSSSLADPDSDGISNLELYFHGFNQGARTIRPVDFLGFHGVSQQGNNEQKPRFRFPVAIGALGVSYALQRSTNLADNSWTTIPHSVVASTNQGTSTLTTIEATNAQAADAKAFYRIAFTLAD